MYKTDKKICFIAGLFILAFFCGCASSPNVKKQEFSEAESMLKSKDLRIRELEALLAGQQLQIQEKDKQIEQLKEKLRSLGVF